MPTVVCVMAKAPVPGRVKTRLSPPLTAEQAARLAAAFLEDTWAAATALPGARVLLAHAGDRASFPASLADAPGFPQDPDPDLGARIEAVARAGLERGSPVLVIGGDLPGLETAALAAAEAALEQHQAVLGPSPRDGGFYLIGVHRCQAGLLAGLPWSRPDTFEACRARLVERGLAPALVQSHDDVDDAADLEALAAALAAGTITAPATAAALRALCA